jgi:hypothetical protein
VGPRFQLDESDLPTVDEALVEPMRGPGAFWDPEAVEEGVVDEYDAALVSYPLSLNQFHKYLFKRVHHEYDAPASLGLTKSPGSNPHPPQSSLTGVRHQDRALGDRPRGQGYEAGLQELMRSQNVQRAVRIT